MAERIGVCADCGARFKIPGAFSRASAKCRKCGGTIEIPRVEPAAEAVAPSPEIDEPAAAVVEPTAMVSDPGSQDAEPAAEAAESVVVEVAEPEPEISEPDAEVAEPFESESEPNALATALAPDRRGGRRRGWGIAAGVILGVSAGFLYFSSKEGGEPASSPPEEAKPTVASLAPALDHQAPAPVVPVEIEKVEPVAAERPPEPPAAVVAEPAAIPEPVVAEPAPEPQRAESSPEPVVPDDPPKPGAPENPPMPAVPENPPKPVAPEVSPTRFVFEPLGSAPGTSDEAWSLMERIAAELHAGASERRLALAALRGFGLEAVPVVVNSLQGLDLSIAAQWAEGDEIARYIQDDLTAQTILIPYRSAFSTDPKEVAGNAKVLKSIVDLWNAQVKDAERWKALVQTYEEKRKAAR
jgi:hypothetical protein